MNCFLFLFLFFLLLSISSGVPVKQESCENLTITSKILPTEKSDKYKSSSLGHPKKPSPKTFWPLETVGGFGVFLRRFLYHSSGGKMMILERSKIIFKSSRAGSLLPLPIIRVRKFVHFFLPTLPARWLGSGGGNLGCVLRCGGSLRGWRFRKFGVRVWWWFMVMVDITILNLEYLQSISSFEIHSWFHMVSLFLTLKFGVIYIYIAFRTRLWKLSSFGKIVEIW